MRKIDVSVDTFALIWAARKPGEDTEDEIVARLASEAIQGREPMHNDDEPCHEADHSEEIPVMHDRPKSSEWVDLLVWSLRSLGGKASLAEIYRKTKDARRLLGMSITRNHEAAARERLESYCFESKNYKQIADLFCMPEGKGAGVWALNEPLPARYR
jgi:hypothetical protein